MATENSPVLDPEGLPCSYWRENGEEGTFGWVEYEFLHAEKEMAK